MRRHSLVLLVLVGILASVSSAQAYDGSSSVSAGRQHTCAIKTNLSALCWGSNAFNESAGPSNNADLFSAVSAGANHTCLIRATNTTGDIRCDGSFASNAVKGPDEATGPFTAITTAAAHTCAIDGAQSISCWGTTADVYVTGPDSASGTFKSVSAGTSRTCAVSTAGALTCWGGTYTVPAGTFKSVSVTFFHGCAIDASDSISCWGEPGPYVTQPDAASGTWRAVSVNNGKTCAIDSAYAITCWGLLNAPAGTFGSISVGDDHACAVDFNGKIACWGDNAFGQTSGPNASTETFVVPGQPAATTDDATGVTATGATLNASINPLGAATQYRYEYGTTTSFGSVVGPFAAGSGMAPTSQPQPVSGLLSNTTYYYRVAAYQGDTPQRVGAVKSFTTGGGAQAPTAVTAAATGVGNTGATLNGTLNAHGQATAYTFEYGPTLSFGSIATVSNGGATSADFAVNAPLSGLSPATTYYYRLVAGNATGTTNGPVMSFTTTGAGSAPIVTTGVASAITTSGATLSGTVNPKGDATVFTFEYGTSTSFGAITAVDSMPGAPTVAQTVSLPVTGLSPGTLYLYRLVATNAQGTTYGPVMAFTTA